MPPLYLRPEAAPRPDRVSFRARDGAFGAPETENRAAACTAGIPAARAAAALGVVADDDAGVGDRVGEQARCARADRDERVVPIEHALTLKHAAGGRVRGADRLSEKIHGVEAAARVPEPADARHDA